MPFTSKRPKLNLTSKELTELTRISKSREEAKSKVERSKMLLMYHNNNTVSFIARALNTNRRKVERCVDKALEYGSITALKDLPRSGRTKEITREAIAWFLSIACTKPKDLGMASEFWTHESLKNYIRQNSDAAGFPCLNKLGKGTVSKILSKSDVKPHKISYYLVKKDKAFEEKMTQVLFVYKEVELLKKKHEEEMTAIFSYDEKPGIQAIEKIAKDLPPAPGKYSSWGRDYEYKRHGTVSLLASINLLNGKIHGKVCDRHRSKEFVEYLKELDKLYPEKFKIKIILDNHSAHISKETKQYLKTKPNRFEFIFTPTHASWLNLIEVFFSKMARSFLRGIRVKGKDELKQRIYQYLDEVNQMPSIFTWKWKLEEIDIA
jgi:transposase